eukprot:gene5514-biopygen20737
MGTPVAALRLSGQGALVHRVVVADHRHVREPAPGAVERRLWQRRGGEAQHGSAVQRGGKHGVDARHCTWRCAWHCPMLTPTAYRCPPVRVGLLKGKSLARGIEAPQKASTRDCGSDVRRREGWASVGRGGGWRGGGGRVPISPEREQTTKRPLAFAPRCEPPRACAPGAQMIRVYAGSSLTFQRVARDSI